MLINHFITAGENEVMDKIVSIIREKTKDCDGDIHVLPSRILIYFWSEDGNESPEFRKNAFKTMKSIIDGISKWSEGVENLNVAKWDVDISDSLVFYIYLDSDFIVFLQIREDSALPYLSLFTNVYAAKLTEANEKIYELNERLGIMYDDNTEVPT